MDNVHLEVAGGVNWNEAELGVEWSVVEWSVVERRGEEWRELARKWRRLTQMLRLLLCNLFLLNRFVAFVDG